MKASQGILTVRGGMTSHAAVVARGMGKCCVSGCGDIKMDEENKQFELAGKVYHEGDWLSIDGSTGNIYDGAVPTVDASIGGEFGRVMGWADKYRRLGVRTNADNPHDTAQAVKFGAEGIGLCRTEHMFFEADRIPAIREMICADTLEQREKALGQARADAAGRLRGHVYRARGPSDDRSLPRSPAARVRPHRGGRHRAARQGYGQERCRDQEHHRLPA